MTNGLTMYTRGGRQAAGLIISVADRPISATITNQIDTEIDSFALGVESGALGLCCPWPSPTSIFIGDIYKNCG